jgi:hypothetical protein
MFGSARWRANIYYFPNTPQPNVGSVTPYHYHHVTLLPAVSSSRSGAMIQRAAGRDGVVVSSRAAPTPLIRTTTIASPWILAPVREDDIVSIY